MEGDKTQTYLKQQRKTKKRLLFMSLLRRIFENNYFAFERFIGIQLNKR
jgi:hypothetical protein